MKVNRILLLFALAAVAVGPLAVWGTSPPSQSAPIIAQQAYLKASNTGLKDMFGESVAVSGDTVVVGAPLEDSNATGVNGNQSNSNAVNSGAVYVYVRTGTVWTQQAYLKASNTGMDDFFGSSVAISGDTLVVGAFGEASELGEGVNNETNNSAPFAGAAYVFVRNGTNWTQQAFLKAFNAEAGDHFGGSVSISGDVVVVGANGEDSGMSYNPYDNTAEDAGAAYVFVRMGTNWFQEAYIKPFNTEAGDFFGGSVSVSGDTIVVGATGESSNARGVNGNMYDNSSPKSGAAYIFMHSGVGPATYWIQQAYLKASNSDAFDAFGQSVAIGFNTVVVGAIGEDSGVNGSNTTSQPETNNSAEAAGAAYVFMRNQGWWTQQTYLKAAYPQAGDAFGFSVATSGDGILVGATGEDSNAKGVDGNQSNNSVPFAGAVYGFGRDESTGWSQKVYLKASNTGANDLFGWAVGFSGDFAVVSARGEASKATGVNGNQLDNSVLTAGAAYIFAGVRPPPGPPPPPPPPPVIVQVPVGTNVPPGAFVVFTVAAVGAPPLFYQWRLNGIDILGATNFVFFLPSVQVTDGGTYSVVVHNFVGAVTSSAELVVSIPPTPPGDNFSDRVGISGTTGVAAGNNDAATFEVNEPKHAGKTGGKSVWYTWQAPDNGIVTFRTTGSTFDTLLAIYTGTSVSDLTLVASDDDQGGFFSSAVTFNAVAGVNYAIAIDGLAGVSGDFVLSWNLEITAAELPLIVTQPVSRTATYGGEATFTVVASGSGLSYQWFFSNNPIPGATEATLVLTNIQASDVGTYKVQVSNGSLRTVESLPVQLEVSATTVVITTDKLSDTLEEEAAVAPAGFVPPGQGGSGGGSVAPGVLGTRILSNLGATTEQGEPNHADALGGASRWQAVVPEADGILTIDTIGSALDTVLAVYTGTSLRDLVLVASDNNSGGGVSSLVRFAASAGTTYLVAIDGVNGAQGAIQLHTRLDLVPVVNVGETNNVITSGESITFAPEISGTPPLSYQWGRNGVSLPGETGATLTVNNATPSNSGDYTLVVSNLSAGASSRPISLRVIGPLPLILTPPATQTVITGETVAFNVVAAATLPMRYEWLYKKKRVARETNATLTISNVMTKRAGAYSVVVSTSSGSVTSAVANLTVLVPVSIKPQPRSRIVAAGKKVLFSIAAKGTLPLTYQWAFNDTIIVAATNKSLMVTNVQAINEGNYSVTVSNPTGSLTSSNATLALLVPQVRASGSGGGSGEDSATILLTPLGDGRMRLTVTGAPGQSYRIEASADLSQWSEIGVVETVAGAAEFVDTSATGQPRRFYRVRSP